MNILLTSAGIRGYLVNYFKDVLKNKDNVFAADCDKYAPALYNADKSFIIPRVEDGNYIKILLDICKKNKIDGIVSLNDLELPVLSKNKDKFLDENIKIIISDPEIIDICYDKYKTYEFLVKNYLPAPKTYISLTKALDHYKKGELKFPVIVKPRKGSASIGIKKIDSKQDLMNEFKDNKGLMIQEMFKGQEYGVDIFNNENCEPLCIFAKKKIKMRAGETDKAVTFYDKEMIDFLKDFSEKLGFYGPADIDLFKQDDKYLITEINPRFGAGYPTSHAVGADFPKKVISLINNEKLKPNFKRYDNDVVMMKQHEIVVKKEKDLV